MNNNKPLIASIIFAAVVISGSLIFLGMQMMDAKTNGTTDLAAEIDKGIQRYIDTQTQQQQAAAEEEQKQMAELAKNVAAPSATDHVRGAADAEVTLINFSDFECPFCKTFHPTAKELMEKYDGKVNWVYRHYPLDFHDPMATIEALASECVAAEAGNDGFWKFADLAFENTTSNGHGLTEEQVYQLAAEAGANAATVKSCVESGKFKSVIEKDMADATKAGITGTPGNILYNNKTKAVVTVHGAQPVEQLSTAVDSLLQK